jgi:hypothetical protein
MDHRDKTKKQVLLRLSWLGPQWRWAQETSLDQMDK